MVRVMGKGTSRHLVQYGHFVQVLLRSYRVLRVMGKGTSRHLVQYGHFVQVFLGF